jgi:hypothetical protein
MPNRGSVNRRTGKTTPRRKGKTRWGAAGLKRSASKSGKAGKSGKSAAAGSKKSSSK